MLEQFVKLPIRKRVGIVAIILGFIAIFAGSPYDRSTTRVNVKDLTNISLKDDHSINADELAEWIIKGKYDYRLIDLRNPEIYSQYNIPGSENIPVREMFNSDLMRNEKIVLYSDEETVAAQGWFLLKADNFQGVYILEGGMSSWKDQILYPKLPTNPSPAQKLKFDKMKEVCKFFGGQPQFDGEEQIKQETPKLKAPPKVTVTKTRKKKSREGC